MPLEWTKTPPIREGYYWWRERAGAAPVVVELATGPGGTVYVLGLDKPLYVILKRYPARQWAGPIEEPREPRGLR